MRGCVGGRGIAVGDNEEQYITMLISAAPWGTPSPVTGSDSTLTPPLTCPTLTCLHTLPILTCSKTHLSPYSPVGTHLSPYSPVGTHLFLNSPVSTLTCLQSSVPRLTCWQSPIPTLVCPHPATFTYPPLEPSPRHTTLIKRVRSPRPSRR